MGWDWLDRPAVALAGLTLTLLCVIPPDGVLSDNEEDYFLLGLRSVSALSGSAATAVFDHAPHRFLADHLLGWLIAGVGFGGAQIVARTLAATAYAIALRAAFRRFDLGTLDAVLVLVVFVRLGQTLFGGEWLFNGIEAKVPAYCLVLAGLALVLAERSLAAAAVLFAAATYCHFLVGTFWFAAAMLLRLLDGRRQLGRVAVASSLFAVLVAPLLGVIAWTRLAAEGVVVAADTPSPDVIYALLRAPHHTAPFIDAATFLAQWLPGYLMAAGMLAGCLVSARSPEAGRLRAPALWLAALTGYLFLALIPAFADRHSAVLGKFYLFRPAALVLLLWLALALAFAKALAGRRAVVLTRLALALVAPLFLLDAALRVAGDRHARARSETSALTQFLAATPQSVVLVDPQLEFLFLDFERRSGHPTLVMWKFMPTSAPEIVEWYRRSRFRDAVFAKGCAGESRYPIDFLLTTPERAPAVAESCGPVVLTSGRVALLQRRR